MGLKPKEYYQIIYRLSGNIATLVGIARVSRSGYYKWLKKRDLPDKDYDDYLLIKEIFEKGKSKYGFRQIKMKLKSQKDIDMNHKKIIRIKHKYGLVTKIRKRNPYKAMFKVTQEHRTFKNKLNRNFKQETPYTFFCTDITYLYFRGRPAYLSAIKDIASGEIVAHQLSRHVDIELVMNTVKRMEEKLKKEQSDSEDILIHSDQGGHYTSPTFFNAIKNLRMIQSMSRRGNCIDNAPIESFFRHLKDDVDYKQCQSFDQLKKVVDDYIEYYNTERQQWSKRKMTPVDYRNHLLSLQ